jgi:hypothetical protein
MKKKIGLGGEIEEDHASEDLTSFSKVKWRAILITSQLSLSLSLFFSLFFSLSRARAELLLSAQSIVGTAFRTYVGIQKRVLG